LRNITEASATAGAASTLLIPEPSLVLLVGAAGSGKSSFAKKHFRPTEVLSSDFCRSLVCDDEGDQAATADAFAVLRFIAARRLRAGRLTVIDATNVKRAARDRSLVLARRFQLPAVAIVLDLPELVCMQQNRERERRVPQMIIQEQLQELRKGLPDLAGEGFASVYVLRSRVEIEHAILERVPTLPSITPPATTPRGNSELPL
jgi:protein phosphatase